VLQALPDTRAPRQARWLRGLGGLAEPSIMRGLIRVSERVRNALASGEAVVALESTIVAHGMPWPRNLEAAMAVEGIVRENGAVPATIGVIDGTPVVGLSEVELKVLAETGPAVPKCSTRELPLVVSKGSHGATTVASTAYLAHSCGIEVFVTGGVGGVHRGGENSLDISADLVALKDLPITVVCAGVKSIP